MKKTFSILGVAFFAISIFLNFNSSLNNYNEDHGTKLFELVLKASASGEYEYPDRQPTEYQGTECCTNDEGCEECVTTVTTKCWLPGNGCTPAWHQDTYTVC